MVKFSSKNSKSFKAIQKLNFNELITAFKAASTFNSIPKKLKS